MTARGLRTVAAGTSAILLLGALTCSPAGAASVDTWTTAFCGGVKALAHSDIDAIKAVRATATDPDTTLTEGKAAIVEYFATVGRAIGDFRARLQKAGAPDVANGSRIQSTAVKWISRMQQAEDEAMRQAESIIDTTDVESFRSSSAEAWQSSDDYHLPFSLLMLFLKRLDDDHALRNQFAEKRKSCNALPY
jgi:hypothetical protein